MPALERLAEQLERRAVLTRVIRAGRVTFAALVGPELPPLLQRPGDLADRHLDADDGPVLAGAEPDPLEHRARLIVALQTLPVLLLGPYGGVIADRVDKRRLMIALQSAMGVQALMLGVLTVTGIVHVWEIGVLAALLGLNNAFENPARQSFMLEMVGPEHLRNAVSLNSVLVNIARVIGPAVAGILIATVGEGVCFLVNAASFVAVVASLTTMNLSALEPTTPTPRARGQLREGLRYVRRTPELAVPLLMMAVAGCLTYEFQVTLPVMASRGLHAGSAGFGFMTAAMGIGAVLGGLLVAARGKTGLRPLVVAAAGFGGRDDVRDARAEPRARADRAGVRRLGQHLVHVDGQLDAAADRGAGDARPRDVAVVRRLPGIDPDRRSARRLVMAVAGARAGLGLGAVTCFVVALAGLAALRGLPLRRQERRARAEVSVVGRTT